jgi:hypothetical protein
MAPNLTPIGRAGNRREAAGSLALTAEDDELLSPRDRVPGD